MFDLPAGQPVASRIGTRFPLPARWRHAAEHCNSSAVRIANPFKAGLAGLFLPVVAAAAPFTAACPPFAETVFSRARNPRILTINQLQGVIVKPEPAYCRRTQLLWGVLLIAIGAVILLDRLDVIYLHDYYALWHYWPLILLVFGLNKLLTPVSAKQVLSGLWLIFFAAWWYVSYEELWNLTFYNSWPALLIAWGVGLVLEPLLNKHFIAYRESEHDK
ncbi:LiaF transmembrane domain-containing protein [Janthinobacterium sp. ROICE36]|uniref:LiaF transmembrane domain-containing protein n=1 Tax=Janthinobacterium sp. ROICE36 TaxID=2048670 RepID=UPI0021558551|nr:DUF5668 domain-containing protein [Janthinobacterium sp. ROICE36]